MTIYLRTSRGDQLMRSRDSALPRRVKSLLISIDGKTDSSVYISSLSAFGDVAELMAILERVGLIRSALSHPDDAPGFADAPATETVRVYDWEALWKSDKDTASPQAAVALPAVPVAAPDWPSVAQAAGDSARMVGGAAAVPQSGENAGQQTRQAIALMTDFINQHLPMQSMELIFALEQIANRDELVASLSGYSTMIAPAGATAAAHLVEVDAALSTH